MTTTIKRFSKMLFAFVLCAGLAATSCETADPVDNDKDPENSENTETPETPSNIIAFADDIVKKSCVEALDTDGDGEVSYDEAAVVTDLSEINLRFKKDFLSFDEFQYFTNVKIIPSSYFHGCAYLKSIVLPESITEIEYWAFNTCKSLKEIVLPESINQIGYGAFKNCISLEKIIIPDKVSAIGLGLFDNCKSLKEIVLPKSLVVIGEETFYSCCSLAKVVFPESLKIIGTRAFRYCTSLTEIEIPQGLEEIWNDAFYGCSLSKVFCKSLTPPAYQRIDGSASLFQENTTVYVPYEAVDSYKGVKGWQSHNIVGYNF